MVGGTNDSRSSVQGTGNKKQEDERDEVLTNLAQAVATRPLDQLALRQTAQVVEKQLGREALVEAAAVSGAFEAFTKVADSTGKESLPPSALRAVGFVLRTTKWLRSWFV